MSRTYIFGVILAAGKSSRMGADKLSLASKNDVNILQQVIDNALSSSLDSVGLIVKSDVFLTNDKNTERLHVKVINSDDMSQSVRAAVNFAIAQRATHVMILLGDMPCVTSRDVDALVEAVGIHPDAFICASHDQKLGNPVVLPLAGCDDWLSRLRGDVGARKIIESGIRPLIKVECSKGVIMDIDTPEDYANYLRT